MAGKTWRVPAAPKIKLEPPKVDFVSGSEGAEVFYKLEGMASLIANIGELAPFYQDCAGYEMADIAAEIIQRAKDEFVPYRDGPLRDSGMSDEYQPGRGIQITEIAMWFAGPGAVLGMGSSGRQVGKSTLHAEVAQAGLHVTDPTVYALEQHENLSFVHPVLGPVTSPQAKYLERPYMEMMPNILPRIAGRIAREMNMNPSFVSFALG